MDNGRCFFVLGTCAVELWLMADRLSQSRVEL